MTFKIIWWCSSLREIAVKSVTCRNKCFLVMSNTRKKCFRMRQNALMATCYVTSNWKHLPTSSCAQTFSLGRLSSPMSETGIKKLHHSDWYQLSMAQRLRKNHDFLKLLVKCTPAQRKAILKAADDALVRTICECVFNVLKETVPVSKPAKRKLLKHKKALTALAEKSTPLNKKKQILVQHGGNFLSVLLPPVLRVLSSLLT